MLLQHRLGLLCPGLDRERDGCVSVDVGPGDVGPVQEELVDAVWVVLHRGEHQGGAAVLVEGVHCGAVAEKKFDNVVVAVGRGLCEKCVGTYFT